MTATPSSHPAETARARASGRVNGGGGRMVRPIPAPRASSVNCCAARSMISSRNRRVLTTEVAMPTYEYRCTKCGEHLEVVQSFKDAPLTECPKCGGELRKVYSPVGIVLKGSGFYKTDSRSGGKSPPPPHND